MNKIIRCINRNLPLVIVLVISAFTIIGCDYFPESTFKLASESRLPKWITLPPGLTRSNVSITMSYYSKPWGTSAKFEVRDAKKKIVEKVDGKVICKKPFQLKTPSQGPAFGYPSYEVITVNGMTEIIEHRKMEPLFYITDDNSVWKQYMATGCG